jgi:hypothetical protein
VICRVEVTLASGTVCHGNYRLRQLEGARMDELPGGDTRDECTLAFFPRELREMLEEENRREEEREAEEAKGVKRSYDRPAGG